jgi:hypothetical protein
MKRAELKPDAPRPSLAVAGSLLWKFIRTAEALGADILRYEDRYGRDAAPDLCLTADERALLLALGLVDQEESPVGFDALTCRKCGLAWDDEHHRDGCPPPGADLVWRADATGI